MLGYLKKVSVKNKIFQIVFLWLIAFLGIQLFFVKIITMEHEVIAIAYYALIISILLILYKNIFRSVTEKVLKKQLFLVGSFLVLHSLIYYICVYFLGEPLQLFGGNDVSFLHADHYFLLAKPVEIFLQQVLLVLLIGMLYEKELGLQKIITLVVIFFGTIHIFLMQKMTFFFGMYFFVFAIIASIVFPYLILRVKRGYVYSFILHLCFYDISLLFFWLFY
jgi:hypothetical protein